MTRIHLYRPCADNAGRFVDAGVDLTVGDAAGADGEGVINAARAAELVESGGAIDPDQAGVLDLLADQHAAESAEG